MIAAWAKSRISFQNLRQCYRVTLRLANVDSWFHWWQRCNILQSQNMWTNITELENYKQIDIQSKIYFLTIWSNININSTEARLTAASFYGIYRVNSDVALGSITDHALKDYFISITMNLNRFPLPVRSLVPRYRHQCGADGGISV